MIVASPPSPPPIGFEAAVARVVSAAAALDVERVPLASALGRIAPEPIVARAELVPYERSAMDGYAVRGCDVAGASKMPLLLPVGGPVYARRGQAAHAPQTATAIATGAPIPAGADAVIPIEDPRRRAGWVEIRTCR